MAFGMSDGSSASALRCSGCSASTLPAQPIRRVVVSLPAPDTTVMYMSSSSRRRRRTVPVSSSNSAWRRSVMMSSDGCSARQSMYASNCAPSDEALRHVHRLALLGAEVAVDAVADGLLVLLGHAEQHPDHAHRHHGAEVGDEVEAAGCRRAGRGTRRRARGSSARGRPPSSG